VIAQHMQIWMIHQKGLLLIIYCHFFHIITVKFTLPRYSVCGFRRMEHKNRDIFIDDDLHCFSDTGSLYCVGKKKAHSTLRRSNKRYSCIFFFYTYKILCGQIKYKKVRNDSSICPSQGPLPT
jgi:hypothetical protein